MAGSVAVRVDGSREARDSLRAAAGKLDQLAPVHREVGAIIEPVARSGAPRGKTGRLAGSGKATGNQREARVSFGGRDVQYGRPIHWGWPARHIRPQPFLMDAVQSTEPRWTRAYHDAVQRILDTIRGA